MHAVVGDFEHHLGDLPGGGTPCRRVPRQHHRQPRTRAARRFLADLAAALAPGDALLLGTDLVKDVDRLVAAYDDAAGVTAEFNRNVLRVLNRELDADFDPDAFEHVARVRPRRTSGSRCACASTRRRRSRRAPRLDVEFAAGEEMRTEISAKFRRAGVERELAAAGFQLAEWWTDPAGDFALSLSFAR